MKKHRKINTGFIVGGIMLLVTIAIGIGITTGALAEPDNVQDLFIMGAFLGIISGIWLGAGLFELANSDEYSIPKLEEIVSETYNEASNTYTIDLGNGPTEYFYEDYRWRDEYGQALDSEIHNWIKGRIIYLKRIANKNV